MPNPDESPALSPLRRAALVADLVHHSNFRTDEAKDPPKEFGRSFTIRGGKWNGEVAIQEAESHARLQLGRHLRIDFMDRESSPVKKASFKILPDGQIVGGRASRPELESDASCDELIRTLLSTEPDPDWNGGTIVLIYSMASHASGMRETAFAPKPVGYFDEHLREARRILEAVRISGPNLRMELVGIDTNESYTIEEPTPEDPHSITVHGNLVSLEFTWTENPDSAPSLEISITAPDDISFYLQPSAFLLTAVGAGGVLISNCDLDYSFSGIEPGTTYQFFVKPLLEGATSQTPEEVNYSFFASLFLEEEGDTLIYTDEGSHPTMILCQVSSGEEHGTDHIDIVFLEEARLLRIHSDGHVEYLNGTSLKFNINTAIEICATNSSHSASDRDKRFYKAILTVLGDSALRKRWAEASSSSSNRPDDSHAKTEKLLIELGLLDFAFMNEAQVAAATKLNGLEFEISASDREKLSRHPFRKLLAEPIELMAEPPMFVRVRLELDRNSESKYLVVLEFASAERETIVDLEPIHLAVSLKGEHGLEVFKPGNAYGELDLGNLAPGRYQLLVERI